MSAFWRVQQDFQPLDDLDHQIEIREGSEDHGIIVSPQSVNQSIMWQRYGRIHCTGISPARSPQSRSETSRRKFLSLFTLGHPPDRARGGCINCFNRATPTKR